MIEHPNSLLLHHCIQAANAGDRHTLRSLWAEDIVWQVKGSGPWAGELKGADEIFEYLADLGDYGNLGFHVEVEDILVSAQGAAVVCHSHAEKGDRILDARYLLVTSVTDRRIQTVTSVPIDPDRDSAFWADELECA